MTTTIPLGDELVLQGPGTSAFRLRVNPTNGQLSIIRDDTETGETWVVDTILRQPGVPGFGYMRNEKADYFGIESTDTTEVGGALDMAPVYVACRDVPASLIKKWAAVGGLAVVCGDNAGGVKNQQAGYMRVVVWNPTPDSATGKIRGRIDWGTYAADGERMVLGRGLLFVDENGNFPVGGDVGDLGPGTINLPGRGGAGGFHVDGRRVDRQTINLGSADVVLANQTRYFGPGYSAAYPSGAGFLTSRPGYVRNFIVRLPGYPNGTVSAVLQRQYQDTSIAVTLSGTTQNATHPGGILCGAGEALGLKITLDGQCAPQGGVVATFDYGA